MNNLLVQRLLLTDVGVNIYKEVFCEEMLMAGLPAKVVWALQAHRHPSLL